MFLCVSCIIEMFLCAAPRSWSEFFLLWLRLCLSQVSTCFFCVCCRAGWGFKTAESDTGTGYPRVKFCWVGLQVKTQQSKKPIVCQKRYPVVKLSWVGIVLKDILFKSCNIASWFSIFKGYRIDWQKIDLMNRPHSVSFLGKSLSQAGLASYE